jgi:hypothetical protein
MHMRRIKNIRKVPFFPLIPVVPVALLVGSFVAALRALVRVRRIERWIATEPA